MRRVRQYRPYRYGRETVRYAHENGPYRTALLGGRTVRTAAGGTGVRHTARACARVMGSLVYSRHYVATPMGVQSSQARRARP